MTMRVTRVDGTRGSSSLRGAAWLACLLPLLAAGCSRGEAHETPDRQTAMVIRDDLLISVEATGQIEPIRKVEVKSKASGEILRLHVDVGDEVVQGTLLAEIDPRDVANAYEQARADLEVAQARREISGSQLRRSEELMAAQVISQEEHESRVLDFANAESAFIRARTTLELAELRQTDVTIRAPLSGTILERPVEEGTVIQSASGNVSGGTTLMTMAALDRVQVRTMVDETEVGQIAVGLASSVRVEAFPERVFNGEVEKIEPQAVVQQNVVMFPVIVTLDNSEGLLKPGMNADVHFTVARKGGALLLPNAAVVRVQDAVPAAGALGLSPDSGRVDPAAFTPLRQAVLGVGAAPAPGTHDLAELRARVERGEISPDSLRALMGGPGGPGGRPGGAGGPMGGNVTNGVESAVVFVLRADGGISPRPVLIGLTDWDNTEILAGLEEGEEVALIGGAQLQAQRQANLERMRSRGGGLPFR